MDSLILSKIEEILNGHIASFLTEPLSSNARAQVHEIAKNMNISSTTVTITGIKEKQIILSAYKEKETHKDFVITPEMIDFFVKFSQIPIPTNNPTNVQYYLKEMENYYSTNLWNVFIEETQINGFGWMKYESCQAKVKALDLIKNNPEYKQFCEKELDMLQLPQNLITKNEIYNHTNVDKYFISIDVKSANYTFLRSLCKSFNPWVEFISMCTTSEFLKKSKYIREVIFGELGNRKLLRNILQLIKIVADVVESKNSLNESMTKIVCSTDEIIYEVDKNYNVSDFMHEINKVCSNTEEIYRVEKFKLVQLKPYNYFVKEIYCSDGNIVSQFKGIPKCLIMQCIKHYQGKEINEVDRKFVVDGMNATFDNNLSFI